MNGQKPAFPPRDGTVFLTDGGLETTLVFIEGIDLPGFAAFPLLLDDEGRQRLERYFVPYLRTAAERGVGFILDTPTWRANAEWGETLGYSREDIAAINRRAVEWARALRDRYAGTGPGISVNGVIGPRGDGYRPERRMTVEEAQAYHGLQAQAFAEAGVDLVSAITMNCPEEAIGIAKAAGEFRIPSVISFTVETDGTLPSGETLQSAIERTDRETEGSPVYYMINCAHPTHFEHVLAAGGPWTERIRGVRANASRKSHAELDASTELDPGDPEDLGRRYRGLRERLRNLSVLGGCCGTDHRHIVAICDACLTA